MIPVVTKQTMQALDKHMIENVGIPSAVLMENAAFGVTSAVAAQFDTATPVVVVCGTGNNGGDGFATARQLRAKGYPVSVYLVGQQSSLKGDAAANAAIAGGLVEIGSEADAERYLGSLCGHVVIDALFGIGLARPAQGLFAAVIAQVNQSGAYVISCDIPSGIDANSGQVLGIAVQANETVTFQCLKPGLLLGAGGAHSGCVTTREIGLMGGFDLGTIRCADSLTLPQRPKDAHKGVFGRLACVVGSAGFAGAGLMCAMGALRAGAGLTTVGVPASLQTLFSARVPECMTCALDEADGAVSEHCTPGIDALMQNRTALAAGCGLGTGSGPAAAVAHMLGNFDVKKVFDADALGIIAQNIKLLENKTGEVVLTPHAAEFSRLCGLEKAQVLADPIGTAQRFAETHGVVLLLKGPCTIVTDGAQTVLVPAGTPGMAKGGSGDVLTGVIGGLLCGADPLGFSSFDAAVLGAYICGKAGEAAAAALGEYAMTPLDTLAHIGQVTKQMTQ